MNLKIKRWQFVAIGILLLLLIVNPTLKDFEEYLGTSARESRFVTPTFKKTSNFLLFSTYQCNNHKYIGVFKNFIEVGNPPPEPPSDSTSIVPDKN